MPGVQAHEVSGKPKGKARHPLETLSQGKAPVTAQAGDTNPSKTQLRQQLRRLRAQLSPRQRQTAARRCARHALRHPVIRRCRHLAAYLAHGAELSTAPLLQALMKRGCRIYLPKLRKDGQMRFIAITARSVLASNQYGIPEPVSGLRRPAKLMNVILLPLVGFDDQGTRLGAGGGYYDRALSFRRSGQRPLRVGYAYALQECRQLPHDPWDVALDAVITEKGSRRWRTG